MMTKCYMTALVLVLSGHGLAAGEDAMDAGRQEYMVACAGCHGESGKGMGPLAELLNIETPDLTTISQRMETESFPYENTMMLIDGRDGIRAHGGEMPVWGERYSASVRATDTSWITPETAELVTKGRILALVAYIASIQE